MIPNNSDQFDENVNHFFALMVLQTFFFVGNDFIAFRWSIDSHRINSPPFTLWDFRVPDAQVTRCDNKQKHHQIKSTKTFSTKKTT